MPRLERPSMVKWYSPRVLLSVAAEVIVSTTVTRIVDPRSLKRRSSDEEAKGMPPVIGFDRGEDLWLDFCADTGEGFNSTFSVARALARERLILRTTLGDRATERGKLLVLGGDLAYPTPTGDNYAKRLIAPFSEALEKAQGGDPGLLAIPGNHDWYDGLSAFTRLFCAPKQHMGAWQTHQERSYFAARLPGDWWLIGIDSQLGSEIDTSQLEFFHSLRDQMCERSRVIACLPAPDWGGLCGTLTPKDYMTEQLEGALGRELDVCISGDLHHYQRHEIRSGAQAGEARQRVTAGGGGAFLHATHKPPPRHSLGNLERMKSFPPAEESRRYVKKLLAFPLTNFSFGLIPAILYAAATMGSLAAGNPSAHGLYSGAFIGLWANPASIFTLLMIFAGCWFLRERKSRRSAGLALLHFAAQCAAVLAVGYAASSVAAELIPVSSKNDWRHFMAASGLAFTGGWLAGSGLMGLYLFASALCYRMLDKAYAALRIQDWKSFVRVHVRSDGALTLYPVGIQRVPRRWARRTALSGESRLTPDDPDATEAELIEEPIEIPANRE